MKNNEEKTNAMRILEQKKLPFSVQTYPGTSAISGVEVAKALGEDPAHMFKTLVTVGKSGGHYVFLVPVAEELDLKKAALSVGEKKIEMLEQKKLFPLTGYIHGGCSPIGMKKLFPTVVDESAQRFPEILFSGGKIGYQIRTSLSVLKEAIPLSVADITRGGDSPT